MLKTIHIKKAYDIKRTFQTVTNLAYFLYKEGIKVGDYYEEKPEIAEDELDDYDIAVLYYEIGDFENASLHFKKIKQLYFSNNWVGKFLHSL